MGTTTHESAGRRRRLGLGRVLLAATLLVATGGAVGYAAWRGDDSNRTPASLASGRTPSRGAPTKASTPTVSSTSSHGKASRTKGFAPVIRNRIPTPTTSLALSVTVPGTTNMQPAAAAAFTKAFAAARAAGLSPEIRSAWRSAQWQQVLFDRAVAKYGSRSEAAKWVLPPQRSAHVKGYAVDVHPRAMARWLQVHGPAYGICRTYDNEWWHFEYLATSTCPPRKPNAGG